MLNDTSALLVVDYSYDFIADDSLLTCGKPGQILKILLFLVSMTLIIIKTIYSFNGFTLFT